jgi:hypothetical protein
MVWKLVGEATYDPGTSALELGPIVVPLVGGLSVKVSTPAPAVSGYGYALLSYRSTYGEELGRVIVWPRVEPTVYRLGEGMRVRDPFGVLVIEPKRASRSWLTPAAILAIRVLADLPDSDLADSLTPPGFADPTGLELSFTPSGDAARITFPP